MGYISLHTNEYLPSIEMLMGSFGVEGVGDFVFLLNFFFFFSKKKNLRIKTKTKDEVESWVL